jgi:hypothetical protein
LAIISVLVHCKSEPVRQTTVSADYCFNESLFQIRTYKNGDHELQEGSKQNIQLTKEMAKELSDLLNHFITQ